jgi:peptide/nickel transport system substrate-binding protein
MRVFELVLDRLHLNNLLAVILLMGLVACNQKPPSPAVTLPIPLVSTPGQPTKDTPDPTPSATLLPAPERLLTIFLGREPASLFHYDATSIAAREILAAIYDGPVDIRAYSAHPVILQKLPSLLDGDALLQPVEVKAGDLIVDSSGNPVNLETGVEFRPSGCTESTCSQSYTGDQPVSMDQLVLSFTLLPEIQWSDGAPLTSADSVYSYELARSLYPAAQPELINRTQSYRALDDHSVEWIGLPGYQDGLYHAKFFTPLPQHAWHDYSIEEIRTTEATSRKPLGWGAYVIDEWIPGDHITLHKNPLYFRAGENLPYFDHLVFRFVGSSDEGLDALQAGECDLVDQTAMLDSSSPRLLELEQDGKIQTFYMNDAGWEQITFGINPLDSQRVGFFALKEVRQAVTMCIDREALVADAPSREQLLTDVYIPASHPLYNQDVRHYDFDPQGGSALLESVGWQDSDNDPGTPRIALGVSGVPDGTPFEVQYLVSDAAKSGSDALAIQVMLAGCGISLKVTYQSPQEYLRSGPDGPVFGRSFDLAQFAWAGAIEPPCYLYLSSEIPGPYLEFSKGWGGVNAGGFSNPEFDLACENALFSLADSAQHLPEHFQAQDIFSEQLPALPLYLHYNVSVARPDLCNYISVSAMDSPLWNLEGLDYGDGCD